MLLVTTMSHEYIAFSAQSIGDEEDLYEDVEGNNFCNRLGFIFSGSITARVRLSRLLSNDRVNIKYMLIESGFLHFQDCICDSVFKISLNFTKLALKLVQVPACFGCLFCISERQIPIL